MQTDIILRQATLADTKDIVNVFLTSRKTFITFAPLIHSDAAVFQWVQNILMPNSELYVAEVNKKVVAMMALSIKEGLSWIEQLYVSPTFIGLGIGSLLIAQAKTLLSPPIYLRTFQQNDGARRFYEKHGFCVLEFSDGSNNEEKCPDILYQWQLPL
ncbi:MAG: GNAT family N-acetyltransferase [Tatlockia sp.]|nr:GNAT family N-acetyltransferase [Tatlockia sp.]